ncbi:J domain-containing protein [Haloferacaceae archaeon DSL9]
MLDEWLSALPTWLILGVVIGVFASITVAGAFYAGNRLFPAAPVDRSRNVDGTVRRRAEIREYLRAIEEPFVEDYDVRGMTVAFYLTARDVAITFDAQAYFRLEAAGVYTVLCEHEMPGRHLGKRLPFEVPELDPEPADDHDPVRAAFAHLGLSRSADESQVRSAYRERVKEVHPDQGGTEAEFRRVREAYATAKNHATKPR